MMPFMMRPRLCLSSRIGGPVDHGAWLCKETDVGSKNCEGAIPKRNGRSRAIYPHEIQGQALIVVVVVASLYLVGHCSAMQTDVLVKVPSTAFPDLQSAVNAPTSSGSVIIEVGAGVFYDSCGVVVSNPMITNLTIMGSNDLKNKTTIDCINYNRSRALTVTLSNATITISNLEFRNGISESGAGVALIGSSLVAATISNCSFFNNTAFGINSDDWGGGGLLVLGSNYSVISVVDCNFYSNVANSSEYSGGGGFLVHFLPNTTVGAVVRISGGNYVSNIAGSGGGGSVQFNNNMENCSVSVEGGSFANNTAPIFSGGGVLINIQGNGAKSSISVREGIYINNTAWSGGAVATSFGGYAFDCDVTIFQGSYYQNIASGEYAGATLLWVEMDAVGGNLQIIGGSYFNNSAVNGGGGVFYRFRRNIENVHTTFENGLFLGNYAIGGGGAYYIFTSGNVFNSSIAIREGSHRSNTGIQGGGAVQFFVNGTFFNSLVTMDGGVFANNTSNLGGAVQIWFAGAVQQSTVNITDGIYVKNLALTGPGGGLQVAAMGEIFSSSLTISGGSYFYNSASLGGGIAATFGRGSNAFAVSIRNVDFTNNYALVGEGGGGGGLGMIFYCEDKMTFDASIDIENCPFNANSATGLGGGALFVMPPGQPLTDQCSICVQDALSSKWLPPSNSFCKYDAIQDMDKSSYCTQYQYLTNYMQNYFVPYHQQVVLKISGVNFRKNHIVGMGGGLVVSNGLIRMSDANFTGNQATEEAGAAYCTGTTEIYFSGTIFVKNNTAAFYTGLLFNSQGGMTIEKDASVTIHAERPQNFSVAQGQFDVIASVEGGILNFLGHYVVTCPKGFTYQYSPPHNVLMFLSGWPNAMNSWSASVTCQACGVQHYSMEAGHLATHNEQPKQYSPECHKCPFGANCDKGMDIILANKDNWGYYSINTTKWSFTRCPLGYCCSEISGCPPSSDQACAKGRNFSVPLCGACLDGYSQNMRGKECTLDKDCTHAKWAWPLFVFVVGVWCAVLIRNSADDSVTELENSDKAIKNFSWILPILLFFFQNVYFLFMVQGGWPHEIMGAISSLANARVSGVSKGSSGPSWTKLCAVPGLTTLGSIFLDLIAPAVMLAMLGLFYGFVKVMVSKFGKRSKIWMLQRIAPAAMNTLLLSYTTIASVTATALHCVKLEGTEIFVIFEAGEFECKSQPWRFGLWTILAVVVLPFPFVLFGVQLHVRKNKIIWRSIATIEVPYLASRWYWPSVILLRRLAIALVYTFIKDSATQGMWLSTFCIIFLVVQLFMSPYISKSANIVEAVSLIVLTLIALCALRNGSYLEANVTQSDVPDATNLTRDLDILQTILFFLPLLAALIFVGWEIIKEKFRVSGDGVETYAKKGKRWLQLSVAAVKDVELSSRHITGDDNDNDNDRARDDSIIQEGRSKSNSSSDSRRIKWLEKLVELERRQRENDRKMLEERERNEREKLEKQYEHERVRYRTRISKLEDALRSAHISI